MAPMMQKLMRIKGNIEGTENIDFLKHFVVNN